MERYNRTAFSTALIAAALWVTACGSNDSTSPQGAPGVVASPQPPTVMTTSLYQADANVPLSNDFRLEAKGSAPLTWELSGGVLPSGIALEASGALVGVPTQEGQFRFTARVTGPGGTAHQEFSLTILGRTHRVSVVSATSTSTPLGEANGPSGEHERSFDPGISGTGRFVVFDSLAGNLVPGINTQGIRQVYLHDRQTGVTELISVDSAEIPGNDASFVAAVSDDGNVVVFDSFASNLAPNDTNNARDVFLRDRQAGTTQRISQFENGAQGICTAPNPLDCNSSDPAISADGSIVVFGSFSRLTGDDSDTVHDVFLFDRTGPSLKRISTGISGTAPNGLSGSPAVSANGRFVAFSSEATNLIPGDTSDGYSDIFVFDVQGGTLRKIAAGVAPDGSSFGPSISGDGRFVAFWSEASNLLSDTNGVSDVFVADMQAQDVPASLKMVVNLQQPPQQGNDASRFPSISRDGKIIAFDSLATNLDATPGNGVRDILVLDRSCSPTFFNAGPCTLERVSKASDESPSNNESRFPALSGDGRFVVFYSDATNLVTAGDNNGYRDAFVRRR